MQQDQEPQSILRHLFAVARFGVLATVQSRQPYANIVAYSTKDDFRAIYFATPRDTRKHLNIKDNPNVAFLINSAENRPDDAERAMAVTALGRAVELAGEERGRIVAAYALKHPALENFARSPASVIMKIDVDRYVIVRQFQHVTVWRPGR